MLTKAKVKLIQGLEERRHRQREGLFIVEGPKVVDELLASTLQIVEVICTETWLFAHAAQVASYPVEVVKYGEMQRITQLTHATDVMALATLPEVTAPDLSHGLWIALDGVQDPGNVGTIIRTAEWFGFKGVLCGDGTADVWSPKVVQSTMGALFRLHVVGCHLTEILVSTTLPVLATVLEGQSIYDVTLPKDAVVIIGNESQGVSQELQSMATGSLTIPAGRTRTGAGLNAAVAAALVMAEWGRR